MQLLHADKSNIPWVPPELELVLLTIFEDGLSRQPDPSPTEHSDSKSCFLKELSFAEPQGTLSSKLCNSLCTPG